MLTSNEYALCCHSWNAIQQRLNSWQDGVSGTNCPIQPGKKLDLRVSDKRTKLALSSTPPPSTCKWLLEDLGQFELTIALWTLFPSHGQKQSLIFSLVIGFTRLQGGLFCLLDRCTWHAKLLHELFTTNYIILGPLRAPGDNGLCVFYCVTREDVPIQDIKYREFPSVLVTADHKEADYYIMAGPKMLSTTDDSSLVGKRVLHYANFMGLCQVALIH
ncbi:hypothetical protein CK203_084144 [Vitis vinifera]|uniref:Plastocyanin-like domain-containing protein n=1 Tax=Vitis vinifera TaxID=29760 RepID=A0A438DUC8_VITVI|nr:hypothetical protein CK203_084144 [Vitis vinifera]